MRGHVAKLFASFGSELQGAERQELLDAETRNALEALGYIR